MGSMIFLMKMHNLHHCAHLNSSLPAALCLLTCDLTNSEGRRLMSNGDLVLSFSAVGSGYDQVDFVTNLGVETTTTTTTTTTTSTTTSSDTNTSTTKSEPASSATRHVFAFWEKSWHLTSLIGHSQHRWHHKHHDFEWHQYKHHFEWRWL